MLTHALLAERCAACETREAALLEQRAHLNALLTKTVAQLNVVTGRKAELGELMALAEMAASAGETVGDGANRRD